MIKPKISPIPKKISSKKIKQDKKIRLAFYGDSPTCATGFATVSRNILMGLHATNRFDIEVYGINYWGEPHDFPFKIWSICFNNDLNGRPDMFGRKKTLELLTKGKRRYDVYLYLNNPHKLTFLSSVISRLNRENHRFASIVYFPIDATPDKMWLENIQDADRLVAYSKYGMRETLKTMAELKSKTSMIYHGVDPNVFFPLPESERILFKRNYFGISKDTYLVTNVNRNQLRKDIPRTIIAFKEFKKKVSNSILYLHMARKDVGGDIVEIAKMLNLKEREDILFPDINFSPDKGVPTELLNKIYNASDLIVSTSTGEGWGLSSIEAMVAKRPCLFPDHTTLSEIFANERGKLIKTGGDQDHFAFVPDAPIRLRPIVHINDMVDKMLWLYKNRSDVQRMVEKSYKWVNQKLIWNKHIVPQWIKLIDEALEHPIQKEIKTITKPSDYIEYI